MLREILYASIDKFGLNDKRTLKASQRFEKAIMKEMKNNGSN